MKNIFLEKERVWQEIGVWFLYSLSFFVLTWPLLKYFSVGIAGYYNSDAPIFLWNAWEWVRKINLGGFTSFLTRDLFFPNYSSLLLHTHTQIQSLLIWFFNIFFRNLVLSFNVVYWLSAVASAYFTYRLFRIWTNSYPAAVLAGHFFGFQHLWAVYVLFGTQNLLSLWYLPAALYFYEVFCRRESNYWLYLVGGILGLAFLNEFIIFAFSALALGVYVVGRIIWVERCGAKQFFGLVLRILAGFLLVAGWKIFIIYWQRELVNQIALPTVSDVDFYHADLINLFRPSRFHFLWGQAGSWFRNVAISNGNAFVGFTFAVTLFYAGLGRLIRGKTKEQNRSGLIWVLFVGYFVSLVLACGPYLHIWGYDTGLSLPTLWISKIIPQMNNLRMPARWLMVATLFFSGIAALLWAYIFSWWKNRAVRIFLFSIFYIGLVIDVLFVPKNILFVKTNISPIFSYINRTNSGSVLELPLAITSGYFSLGESARINMLHQTIHNRPIIGGHLSRLPFSLRDYYLQQPVIKYILNFQNSHPNQDDLNEDNIRYFFSHFEARHVIWDKKLADPKTPEALRLQKYLVDNLKLVLVYEDKDFIYYQVK